MILIEVVLVWVLALCDSDRSGSGMGSIPVCLVLIEAVLLWFQGQTTLLRPTATPPMPPTVKPGGSLTPAYWVSRTTPVGAYWSLHWHDDSYTNSSRINGLVVRSLMRYTITVAIHGQKQIHSK